MRTIEGGITAAKGFQAAGIDCGIKKKKKDLALIFSSTEANMAATFTTNIVKAAPVVWNKHLIENYSKGQAIIINSGVANACTGTEGEKNNLEMAEYTAKCLNIDKEKVFVASTGVIGKQLPMKTIKNGIDVIVPKLNDSDENARKAAEAIMTTDTFSKEIAIAVTIDEKTIHIGGMAKGSGMIHPNMATMLSFITTDCSISKELLQKALKDSIVDSYNMISVDGDTSTNDMVIVMANGVAGNNEIVEENNDYNIFKEALHYVNVFLAKSIATDGEGATKLLEVNVKGAKSKQDARMLSKTVIESSLVKTAIFGEDANWGRIICAMGYSGVTFDTEDVEVHLISSKGDIKIVEKGVGTGYDETKASYVLSDKNIKINVILHEGSEEATAWGCDLSYDYVKINADYRT